MTMFCFIFPRKMYRRDVVFSIFSLLFGAFTSTSLFIFPDYLSSIYGYDNKNVFVVYLKLFSCSIGLIGFCLYIYNLYSKNNKLFYMFLFGICYFFVGLFWLNQSMHIYGGLPLILSLSMCLLFSIYNGLFFVLSLLISPRFVFIPFSFVLCEWLRGNLFTGFPWLNLGYSLVDTPFNFIAEYFGVYGVEFLSIFFIAVFILFINFLNLKNFNYKRFFQYGLLLSFFLIFILSAHNYNAINIKSNSNENDFISVKVIQGAISQDKKFVRENILANIDFHLDLMLKNNDNFIPDLIITPETAFPVVINNLPMYVYEKMLEYSKKYSTAILFGAAGVLNDQYTNSLFFISNDELSPKIYYKYHLVPFGEFVPYGFKWFVNNLIMPMGDFARGGLVQNSFTFYKNGKQFKISANICYEVLFGEEMAQVNYKNNPHIFVNSTNLGWFGNSGLVQFLNISRMRALELKKSIVIANNSGISAVILPNAKVEKWINIKTPGVLTFKLPINSEISFYTKYKNMPILSIILFGFTILLYYYFFSRKNIHIAI